MRNSILKRMTAVLMIFSMVITCFGHIVHAEDTVLSTSLQIDESQIIKPSDKRILGINDAWKTSQLHMQNSDSTELSQNYLDTIRQTQVPIELARMSGTDSNDFYWKDTIGSLDERANTTNYGLVEWIKVNQAINPDVSFTFTLNIFNDTIENHKDLTRFLTLMPDDPNAIGSDGSNWAQRRVDLGIHEPVKLELFELGNEVYNRLLFGDDSEMDRGDSVSVAAAEEAARKYITLCKEIASAIHEVNPNVNLSACLFSYGQANSSNSVAWNDPVIRELYPDYCSHFSHHYYGKDYNFYWVSLQIRGRIMTILDEVVAAHPECEPPKLYFSEYGYWMSGKDMNVLTAGTNLSGTLICARMLTIFMQLRYLEMADIHTTYEQISIDEQWQTGWDLFRMFCDGSIHVTGPAEMLKVFAEALGDGKEGENVVYTYLNGSHEYFMNHLANYIELPWDEAKYTNRPSSAMYAGACTTAEGGLNVVLVNSDPSVTHELQIQTNNEYKLKEEVILTSTSAKDNNTKQTPDVLYTKKNLIQSEEKITTYTLEPMRLVVLKLVPLQYEYAAENDVMEISYENQLGETNGIPIFGKEFGIACKLYDNKELADNTGMTIVVPKQGEDTVQIHENLFAQFDKICYFNQTDVKRNIAYFSVIMPEIAPSGEYEAIIEHGDGSYSSVPFYYEAEKNGNVKVVTVANKSNEGIIEEHESTVEVSVEFTDKTTIGDEYLVRVYQQAEQDTSIGFVAHVGTVKVGENRKAVYQFPMPLYALTGDYCVQVTKDINGAVFAYDTFSYTRDDLFSINPFIKNQKEEILTWETLWQTEYIDIPVYNQDRDNVVACMAFLCVYGENKELLQCYLTRDTVEGNKEKTIRISMELATLQTVNDKADYARIFLFCDGTMKPCTELFEIR